MTDKKVRGPWSAAGLAIAFLGIPAVTLAYRELVGANTGIGPMLLRELVIFALLGLMLLIVRRGERLPLSSIGLRSGRNGRSLLWAMLIFVALGAGTALSLVVLPMLGLSYGGGSRTFVPPLWLMALVVLRAGIVEEVFYRGYAIERVQAVTGSRAAATLIPLVAFAGFHFQQGVAGVLIAFVLGAVLTGFYLWRRDLKANIAGHFLIDFVPNVVLPMLG